MIEAPQLNPIDKRRSILAPAFLLVRQAWRQAPGLAGRGSRQLKTITSIDNGVPVIAVYHQDHTVVANGGKWHREGGYQIWDFVYFHDPGKSFGNSRFQATQWMDDVCPGFGTYCNQIVSSSAAAYAVQYLGTWGTTTVPAGGGYDPSGTWPPAT